MKQEKQKALSQKEPSAEAPKRKFKKGELQYGSHPTIAGEPARFVGWVNNHGVEFPQGNYPEFHCHISSRGDVVVRECPRCHIIPMASLSIKGYCPDDKCGFSALSLMDEIAD